MTLHDGYLMTRHAKGRVKSVAFNIDAVQDSTVSVPSPSAHLIRLVRVIQARLQGGQRFFIQNCIYDTFCVLLAVYPLPAVPISGGKMM